MAITGSDGHIILSTKVDTSGINKGMNSIKGLVGKVGAAIGIAFSVSTLVNFGKAAINLASDLQEVQNVVDVAFGSMSYKIEEFSKTAIEKFGISELTAKRTASTYMAMAKGMGIADDVASDMAITMTGLTADLASFYNISQERADVILKSVYTGETETLKQLGIVMTEVNLANFAMSKGITKSLSAMTQQEKTMLRYQFVLEQTRLAQGDFVRTQDSWANQTRVLTERWKEMQAQFGEAFMRLGTLILPAINKLIEGLTVVAQIAKAASQNIYEMFTGEKMETQEAQSAVSGLGDSSETAAEGVDGLGDSIEKTGKKTKKALAAFDEIQILTSQIEENTGGIEDNLSIPTLGSVSGGSSSETTENDTGKYKEMAKAIKETLADILSAASKALLAVGVIALFSGNIPLGLGLIIASKVAGDTADVLSSENPAETLKEKLEELKKIITPALFAIGVLLLFSGNIPLGIGLIIVGAVHAGYEEVQTEEFDTASFESKLNVIVQYVSAALAAIGVILIFFGHIPLGIGLIIAGKELFEATEANINEGEVTTKIQKFFEQSKDLIVGMSIAALTIGLILVSNGIITPISLGLIAAGATALNITAAATGQSVIELIMSFFNEILIAISGFLIVIGVLLLLTPGTTGLGIAAIALGVVGLVSEMVINGSEIKNIIQQNLYDILTTVSAFLLVLGVLLLFTPAWSYGVGAILMSVMTLVGATQLNNGEIKGTLSSFLQDLLNMIMMFSLVIGTILLFVPGMTSLGVTLIAAGLGGLLFSSITDFGGNEAKEQLRSELDAMNDEAQRGVDEINNTLSQIQFSGWGGGSTSGHGASRSFGYSGNTMSTFNVPALARGAVLPANKPFLAVVGDQKQGTNIEAPLATIEQAVTNVLNRQGMNGGVNTTVVMEIDGRELARVLVPNIETEQRITGVGLISK